MQSGGKATKHVVNTFLEGYRRGGMARCDKKFLLRKRVLGVLTSMEKHEIYLQAA